LVSILEALLFLQFEYCGGYDVELRWDAFCQSLNQLSVKHWLGGLHSCDIAEGNIVRSNKAVRHLYSLRFQHVT
jgi:hypothetical protein